MERYYLLDGNNVIGPFTVDQLKEISLKLDSLICREGTENWKKLSDFSELNNLRPYLPPPSPPKNISRKVAFANSIKIVFSKVYFKKILMIGGAALLIGLAAGLISFYGASEGQVYLERYNEYHSFKLKYDISDTQLLISQDAMDYLIYNTNWRKDRWNFIDLHHAESYYKEQYLQSKSVSILTGIFTPLFIMFFVVLIFVITNFTTWVNKNSTK